MAPVLSTPAPPAPSTSPARAPISDSSAAGAPQDVARSRVEAYNRRDLEALASLYAPDARVYDPPDQLRDSGIAQIRRSYAQRLASAGRARLTVEQRMTQGNYVVEREIETGEPGLSASALVVSEIRHGRIVRVWVLR